MIELEVYAAGRRHLDKILKLDHQFERVPGQRDKADHNPDITCLELDKPTITSPEIGSIFIQLRLESRLIGAVPAEWRPRSKTQLPRV